MRLAVDARLMAGHPRGMGQYARALVTPLGQALTALLPAGQQAREWPTLSQGAGFFPWWEQVMLSRMARRVGATHLLCPSNTGPIRPVQGLRTIAVVHDLIYMRPLSELPLSRSMYQNLGRLYRREVVPYVVKHADVLVTVSEFTRQEMHERFGVPLERIRVIPNTLRDDWFVPAPLPDDLRSRELLCVTGEGPSKNLSGLLRAFSRMRANGVGSNLRLRVVGVKPAFHAGFLAEASALNIDDALCLEGFVSEADLQRMYREAWVFVLPSFFEGFGIPLIEAMASGTPVACSNTTSLPEVAGASSWLFDPLDTGSMAESLAAAVTSADRTMRAQLGIEHARRFAHGTVMRQIDSFWKDMK